jgi:hypothetical protein
VDHSETLAVLRDEEQALEVLSAAISSVVLLVESNPGTFHQEPVRLETALVGAPIRRIWE